MSIPIVDPVTGLPLEVTDHGRRVVATRMFRRGHAFIGAAVLLSQGRTAGGEVITDDGFAWAILQLWCQGIEVSVKGLLLFKDYNRFEPRLRKLGHKIYEIAKEALAAYGLKPMRLEVEKELRELEKLYSQNLLRYSSPEDMLKEPKAVESDEIKHFMYAACRLAYRELGSAFDESTGRFKS